MSINLIALLTVLLVQVMITVALNSLWRTLQKAGLLLKALLLQVPLFRGTYMRMEELEETAARRKAERKGTPGQRQPTLEMEADPGNHRVANISYVSISHLSEVSSQNSGDFSGKTLG